MNIPLPLHLFSLSVSLIINFNKINKGENNCISMFNLLDIILPTPSLQITGIIQLLPGTLTIDSHIIVVPYLRILHLQ